MVVDCSVFHGRYIELAFLNKTLEDLEAEKDPPPDEVDKIVWAAMDTAFSEPVSDSDDTAEYAPTQIIAELFRSEGYDGVAYKSAFGEDAYSVALFDIDSANQLNGAIYKTKAVEYKFEERGSPHFIS
jgi:hypothetical protein